MDSTPMSSLDQGDRFGDIPQKVSREQMMSVAIPVLNKTNYPTWVMRMKVLLEAQGLWDVVETGKADRKAERQALMAIFRAIDEPTLLQLDGSMSAKEAWETLLRMNAGVERVKMARLQALVKEMELLVMKEDESVIEYAGKLSRVANQIRGLGETLTDGALVAKLLRAMPAKFDHLVSSME